MALADGHIYGQISIHALREEGDQLNNNLNPPTQEISIHALREEGDGAPHPAGARTRHFYPRPPRGGRPRWLTSWAAPTAISIHALREEGDTSTTQPASSTENFYPRPPRGGRRQGLQLVKKAGGFLSTPSARRATLDLRYLTAHKCISIHALREEGDSVEVRGWMLKAKFLSTPSARRATRSVRGLVFFT